MKQLVKKRAFRGAGDCVHLGNDGAADAPGNVMGTVLGGPQQFQDILCLLEIGMEYFGISSVETDKKTWLPVFIFETKRDFEKPRSG